jgi:DNA-directed RNA polymerase subunit RPC12/RpoP
MSTKKTIRVKMKKKPMTLAAKNVQRADAEAGEKEEPVARKKVVISKPGPQPEKDDSAEISEIPKPSQTFHIEDPDEEVLDASDSMAVELNSSTIKDPVKQVPLEPEEMEQSPPEIPPEKKEVPTFKFYCYRCGQKLKVPVEWANMSTRCLRCGHDIVVPPPLMELES